MKRLKNFLENVFLWRSLEKFLRRPFFFFFFWRALAPVSLVLGLGLEHSYPWPRECLSSERLSLALASDFFVSLALASSLVSSTPPLTIIFSSYKERFKISHSLVGKWPSKNKGTRDERRSFQ